MFYVIDSELAEKEKVKLLANSELADAIFQGFVSSLRRENLPSVEKIGHAMAEKKEFSEGYVILAGLDLMAQKSIADIAELNNNIIESAVAFHFSNKTGHHNIWFDYLLSEHKERVIPVLSKYWMAMLKNHACYLPGRNYVLGETPDVRITEFCILQLLENWTKCKAKILFQLLQLAFMYSKKEDLLAVCERVLSNDHALNEKTRLYWIATAYLISPDKYYAKLTNYVGRVKLKIMPLLDFIALIMANKKNINIEFSDNLVVQLLKMIAPVFPPQHHVYGAIGALDINSKNVMLLFYHLASSDNKNIENEIKLLRKARVLKIYSAVIDNLTALQTRKNNEKDFSFPDFDSYIKILVNNNCLEGRSNKFDLR